LRSLAIAFAASIHRRDFVQMRHIVIPATAGIYEFRRQFQFVIPANAGIQGLSCERVWYFDRRDGPDVTCISCGLAPCMRPRLHALSFERPWIPAFAAMTVTGCSAFKAS
jgi:hypothetical protein